MQASVFTSPRQPATDFARKPSTLRSDPIMDAKLTSRVKEAVIAAGSITAKNILIETANGIVTLSGPVDSEVMRKATLTAARSVCGVPSVIDRLFLRGR